MFLSQVVNGAVLPFVLIFMLILINDRKLMGNFANGPTFNLIAWITVIVMIALTLLMTIDIVNPGSSDVSWIITGRRIPKVPPQMHHPLRGAGLSSELQK